MFGFLDCRVLTRGEIVDYSLTVVAFKVELLV